MNKKNTKYLYEKYPKIFAEKDLPETESCMSLGFECGDGWFKIIDLLCCKIQAHVDNPHWTLAHPRVYNWAKEVYNRLFWNHIFYPIGKQFLRGVPISYPAKDSSKYEKQHARYNKWQKFFQAPSPKYKEPPFDPNRQVVALQVKEKFGVLNFYYRGGDDYIRGLVTMAEVVSSHTCEICGIMDKTVKPNRGNWIAIRCDLCRNKF